MRLFPPLPCVLLLLLGCSESSEASKDAGPSIRFDAAPTDALPTPDAPESDGDSPADGDGDSDIGEACRGDMDCGGLCIEDENFPGGYCSDLCAAEGDCPAGSTCTPVGRGTALCLLDCDPAVEDPCARPGFGCSADALVCLPGCSENSDCADGLQCGRGSGGAGACFDPDAELGDACEEDESCPEGGLCIRLDFSGWPGGSCVQFGCDAESGEGCPVGATCVAGPRGGLCLAACEGDDNCREGYACEGDDEDPAGRSCRPACTDDAQCGDELVCNPAVGTCDVPFDPEELGAPCSTVRGACAGGTCLTEFDSGFPGSACAFTGCTLGVDADDGCPGDGVCLEGAGGSNVCIAGCSQDTDCRDGYACRPVDEEDTARGMGCFPACRSDDVCANDGTGGAPDFSCNRGTGRCTFPFEAARVGEPCEDLDDCPGGLCRSEAEDGWPAGSCFATGCRLSGEGPTQACPDASVCIDDAVGDETLGICAAACTTMASGSCRPGYACEALADGGTEGTCVPACDEDSCASGRVCGDDGLCIVADEESVPEEENDPEGDGEPGEGT